MSLQNYIPCSGFTNILSVTLNQNMEEFVITLISSSASASHFLLFVVKYVLKKIK